MLAPYAKQLLAEETGSNWQFWLSEAGNYAQTLLAIPPKAESVLRKLDSGNLAVRLPSTERQLELINRQARRLVNAVLFLGLLTNSTWLYLNQQHTLAAILGTASLLALWRASTARGRHRF